MVVRTAQPKTGVRDYWTVPAKSTTQYQTNRIDMKVANSQDIFIPNKG